MFTSLTLAANMIRRMAGLATWTFTLRGRRGTYSTGRALVVRLGLAGVAAVCVAGVALGDSNVHASQV